MYFLASILASNEDIETSESEIPQVNAELRAASRPSHLRARDTFVCLHSAYCGTRSTPLCINFIARYSRTFLSATADIHDLHPLVDGGSALRCPVELVGAL
ncbi:hypothetical protein WJX77_002652 [Trebouxia sp. C0004]